MAGKRAISLPERRRERFLDCQMQAIRLAMALTAALLLKGRLLFPNSGYMLRLTFTRPGDNTMFKKLLIFGLAVLTAACVPIQPLPPEAGIETVAEMPGPLVSCDPTYSILKVGHSADDLPTNDVPDYVDIVRVESSLDGEILTVVFYLKSLSQEVTVNREGLSDSAIDSDEAGIPFEYYWNVNIDVHGAAQSPNNNTLFDYMFSAVIDPGSLGLESPPTALDFEDALDLSFFAFDHPADRQRLSRLHHAGPAQLHISYEDNSLTFSSKVPGITDNATLFFYADDVLLGHDGISCHPG